MNFELFSDDVSADNTSCGVYELAPHTRLLRGFVLPHEMKLLAQINE